MNPEEIQNVLEKGKQKWTLIEVFSSNFHLLLVVSDTAVPSLTWHSIQNLLLYLDSPHM